MRTRKIRTRKLLRWIFFFFLLFFLFPIFAFSHTEISSLPTPGSQSPFPQNADSFVSRSLAGFSYFIDQLTLPLQQIGLVWATPRSVYEGPFFTNDTLHIDLPPQYFESGQSPFFRGPVFTGGKEIVFYRGYGPYTSSGKINPERFQMIFQQKVELGVPRVSLPDYPQESVKQGALGNLDLANIKGKGKELPKIFLPQDQENHWTGGILVNGDLDTLLFESTESENFQILLGYQGKKAIVSVDFKGQETTLTLPGEKAVFYPGVPNGAFYIRGSIGNPRSAGVQGSVRGRWTVACEGDLFISGNLTYSDTAAGSEPAGNDVLSLIARNVFISKDAPDLLYLYATIMAAKREGKERLGTMLVLPNRDLPRLGELIWWGNYIGEYPAIMGTFDRDTGASADGYDLHKFFDSRLAENPPPFFPTAMVPASLGSLGKNEEGSGATELRK